MKPLLNNERGGQRTAWLTQKKLERLDPDVATTVMSRDYKGISGGFQPQSAVITAVLTPKRNEYGKKIRKQYESHLIHSKRAMMNRMEPRSDGITNTITTVQKDNMVIESKWKKNGL